MRVLGIVQQLVEPCRPLVHAVRLRCLLAAVAAVLVGRRLSLTCIGRSLRGRADPKHAIKRIDRLLSNGHLHRERLLFHRAIAKRLLRGVERPLLIVDWTQTTDAFYSLVAAVPVDGRALPIYLETHPNRLHTNRRVQQRFLRKLRDVLPRGARPILILDAGFRAPFFRDVEELGWDFVARVRGQTQARLPGWTNTWLAPADLYQWSSTRAQDLGRCRLARQRGATYARLILSPRPRKKLDRSRWYPTKRGCGMLDRSPKREREPLLLATSIDAFSAAVIIRFYKLRMQIEEAFRDAKNHRFGWSFEDARSRSAQRLQVLLLLATLAMVAVTLLGYAAETQNLHHRYQANTVRTRRVLSHFVLGCLVIARGDRRVAVPDLAQALRDVLFRLDRFPLG